MRKQMNNSDFKKARQQLGLTQLQLAEKLGLTNRQIIRLEQDHPIQKQTELAINYLVTLSALDE
jgi:transcriptional regulator with XRE-family HTH domain